MAPWLVGKTANFKFLSVIAVYFHSITLYFITNQLYIKAYYYTANPMTLWQVVKMLPFIQMSCFRLNTTLLYHQLSYSTELSLYWYFFKSFYFCANPSQGSLKFDSTFSVNINFLHFLEELSKVFCVALLPNKQPKCLNLILEKTYSSHHLVKATTWLHCAEKSHLWFCIP